MKFSTIFLSVLALVSPVARGAASERDVLKVVATVPDLADLARVIGGDGVDVTSIAAGTMNVHAVPLKPSVLIAVNKADLFLQIGLSLEHAYVPGLLMKARNPRIAPDAPGFVDCSRGWTPIDVPASVSRSEGTDLHPLGNPHYNLDPRGGAHIAERVLAGLCAVDPGGKDGYTARHAAWKEQYDEALERWKRVAESLAGRKVVTYHKDFDYLLRALGIEVIGTVEPRPGVPPTPGALATLVERMRAEDVRVVLTARWSNDKSVRFVAERTDARVVELPVLVGGARGADTWLAMMDLLHARLAEAFDA